ncbi:MAG: hypothetical protein KAQ98_13755, partial [Bacteriovoracaceae bacterium]|nr:hypothetical protein [Bacteriovoracaceae bacterium]
AAAILFLITHVKTSTAFISSCPNNDCITGKPADDGHIYNLQGKVEEMKCNFAMKEFEGGAVPDLKEIDFKNHCLCGLKGKKETDLLSAIEATNKKNKRIVGKSLKAAFFGKTMTLNRVFKFNQLRSTEIPDIKMCSITNVKKMAFAKSGCSEDRIKQNLMDYFGVPEEQNYEDFEKSFEQLYSKFKDDKFGKSCFDDKSNEALVIDDYARLLKNGTLESVVLRSKKLLKGRRYKKLFEDVLSAKNPLLAMKKHKNKKFQNLARRIEASHILKAIFSSKNTANLFTNKARGLTDLRAANDNMLDFINEVMSNNNNTNEMIKNIDDECGSIVNSFADVLCSDPKALPKLENFKIGREINGSSDEGLKFSSNESIGYCLNIHCSDKNNNLGKYCAEYAGNIYNLDTTINILEDITSNAYKVNYENAVDVEFDEKNISKFCLFKKEYPTFESFESAVDDIKCDTETGDCQSYKRAYGQVLKNIHNQALADLKKLQESSSENAQMSGEEQEEYVTNRKNEIYDGLHKDDIMDFVFKGTLLETVKVPYLVIEKTNNMETVPKDSSSDKTPQKDQKRLVRNKTPKKSSEYNSGQLPGPGSAPSSSEKKESYTPPGQGGKIDDRTNVQSKNRSYDQKRKPSGKTYQSNNNDQRRGDIGNYSSGGFSNSGGGISNQPEMLNSFSDFSWQDTNKMYDSLKNDGFGRKLDKKEKEELNSIYDYITNKHGAKKLGKKELEKLKKKIRYFNGKIAQNKLLDSNGIPDKAAVLALAMKYPKLLGESENLDQLLTVIRNKGFITLEQAKNLAEKFNMKFDPTKPFVVDEGESGLALYKPEINNGEIISFHKALAISKKLYEKFRESQKQTDPVMRANELVKVLYLESKTPLPSFHNIDGYRLYFLYNDVDRKNGGKHVVRAEKGNVKFVFTLNPTEMLDSNSTDGGGYDLKDVIKLKNGLNKKEINNLIEKERKELMKKF